MLERVTAGRRANAGIREAVRRLAEGSHRWGGISVSPSRFGITRYTLRIYPPGLDRHGRVRLRVADAWRVAEVPLGVGVFVAVSAGGSDLGAVAAASIVWLTGWSGTRWLTRRERPGVLELRGTAGLDASDARELRELFAAVDTLTAADAALAEGALTGVEYELTWILAYDRASGPWR
jgi:hypothetical protein